MVKVGDKVRIIEAMTPCGNVKGIIRKVRSIDKDKNITVKIMWDEIILREVDYEEITTTVQKANNIQQQPQECGNTSKSCVEEKNNQIGVHGSVNSDNGAITNDSVEYYQPCSSPVVDSQSLNKTSEVENGD